jgi:triphosphatase
MGSQPESPAGDSATDIEVEWQFDAIDLRPVERWISALPMMAKPLATSPSLTAFAKPSRRLVDRYLDTDDWRVGQAGYVLRTRRRGRNDEATLKDTRPADSAGLRHRLEVTEAMVESDISALGTTGPVGRRVSSLAGRRPLRQILEVRTRRRPFSLRVSGEEVAEIALDDTVIAVGEGERPVQLRRVEVEVVPEWVEHLEPYVRVLQASCGLQPASFSKFEAGLLAIGATIPGPVDLGPTDVSPQATLGELAHAVIRQHLGVLLAKEPGTRLGEDAEELHDMRVATRRLRAALDIFLPVLPVRARTLRQELSWLAAALGHVRDLDVQLAGMEEMDRWSAPWADPGDGEVATSPLDDLRQLLLVERDVARTALLDALDSTRWERLKKAMTTLVAPGASRRLVAGRTPAVIGVPALVATRHHAVVKAARKARKSGVAADFHRVRIRGKRLRYSLEFTSALYGERTDRFTRRLAKLQDKLGLMQDAEVGAARLLDLATTSGQALPVRTIFVMGSVAEHYRREALVLLEHMPQKLEQVSGKEWKDLLAQMERQRAEALKAIEAAEAAKITAAARTAKPTFAAVLASRKAASPRENNEAAALDGPTLEADQPTVSMVRDEARTNVHPSSVPFTPTDPEPEPTPLRLAGSSQLGADGDSSSHAGVTDKSSDESTEPISLDDRRNPPLAPPETSEDPSSGAPTGN